MFLCMFQKVCLPQYCSAASLEIGDHHNISTQSIPFTVASSTSLENLLVDNWPKGTTKVNSNTEQNLIIAFCCDQKAEFRMRIN
jgi:hypothetical protein